MPRKALSIVLLAIVLSHLGAMWSIYSAALWLHKQNKEVRLSDKTRWEEITLSSTAFEAALVEEDEIEIDNQLFDIVSSFRNGDIIQLIVVADHAENKMKRTLSGLQKEKTGWSNFAKQADSFACSVFHPETTLRICQQNFVMRSVHYQIQDNLICKGKQSVPEQPPAI